MEDWAQTVRDQGDVMDTMSGNVSNRPLRSIRRGRARPGRSELVAKGRPVVNRLACATAVTPQACRWQDRRTLFARYCQA